MEESMSLFSAIKREFSCGSADIKTYSPLTLAFVGDAVYDLIVRSLVAAGANASPNLLHKKKSGIVKAGVQAACAQALLDELSEEEMAVYKRGRNAHSHSVAKNASVGDYRKATGLEALFGYLYLCGETDRLLSLVRRAFEKLGMEI